MTTAFKLRTLIAAILILILAAIPLQSPIPIRTRG